MTAAPWPGSTASFPDRTSSKARRDKPARSIDLTPPSTWMSLMGKQPIAMSFGGTAVRPAGQTASGFLVRQAVQAALIATISAGLLWLVWIYGNGLRDPRYLDGWILAAGMGLQL